MYDLHASAILLVGDKLKHYAVFVVFTVYIIVGCNSSELGSIGMGVKADSQYN